jgi:hypothetical protein
MLGLKPWEFPAAAPEGAAAPVPPSAAAFAQVWVAWEAPGGNRVEPIDFFLTRRRDKRRAATLPLLFTGSYYYADEAGKQYFAASSSGIFIALLRNPAALFNLPWFEPSPYGETVAGFGVKVSELPPEMREIRRVDVADKEGVVREVERIIPADKTVTVIFRPVAADAAVTQLMREPAPAGAAPPTE